MKYRSEIDGLRAVAVVPVVLFHAGFESFSGGFIGVDVFFVISGFLITSIIISELATDNFRISKFYERRARRILPALFVVIGSCLAFAWVLLPAAELLTFSESVLSTLFFVSNIFFWRERNDYFAPASEEQILLHTWSLSIEEQFYLFFPILMILLWRWKSEGVLTTIVLVAIFSLLLNIWALENQAISPSAVFYLLPTRAWELMCGSICAVALRGRKLPSSEAASIMGLFAILASVFFFDHSTPSPSLYLLLPVIGTCAILVFGQGTIIGTVLSWRPIVSVGLVSYSLYLWHQPLFAFARTRMLDEPTPIIYIGLILVSISLAWITWRFIEGPFRKKKDGSITTRAVYTSLSICLVLFLASAILTVQNAGFPNRFAHLEDWRGENFNQPTDEVSKECRFYGSIQKQKLETCLDASETSVVLLGDSHADTLFSPLASQLVDSEHGFAALINHACFPMPGMQVVGPSDEANCDRFKQEAWQFIDSRNDLVVILSMRWALYLSGERFENLEGGAERSPTKKYVVAPNILLDKQSAYEPHDYIVDFFRERAESNRFVILTQYPEAGWDVNKWVAYSPDVLAEGLSTPIEAYERRNGKIDQTLTSLKRFNVELVQLSQLVCDNHVRDRCVILWRDKTYYSDTNHPSPYAANLIATEILKRVNSEN